MKFNVNVVTNIVAAVAVAIQSYIQFSTGVADVPTILNTTIGAIALYFIGKK